MKKKHQIIFHCVIWLLVYIIPTVRQIIHFQNRFEIHDYWNLAFNSIFNTFNFYLFYFFFLPKSIQDLRKIKTIIQIGAFIIAMIALRYITSNIFRDLINLNFFFNLCHTLSYAFQTTLFYTLLAGIVKLSMDWFFFQDIQRELLLHKKQSELSMLRTQINPHFLFNTLNNIYALAQNKSDETPKAIFMLSQMMRYTTKDIYKEFVPLKEEIQFINNFISLQKLRLNNAESINLITNGDFNNKKIAPLLLIVFVENSFKHGKSINAKGVNIYITINNKNITLKVINCYDPKAKNTRVGTGIKNVKKRLEILYKGNYSLNITPNERKKEFSVELKIVL